MGKMGNKRTMTLMVVSMLVAVLTIYSLAKDYDSIRLITVESRISDESSSSAASPSKKKKKKKSPPQVTQQPQGEEESIRMSKHQSVDPMKRHDKTTAAAKNSRATNQSSSRTTLATSPPYIQITHVPSQRREEYRLRDSTTTITRPDSVSLVVGYWAQPGTFAGTDPTLVDKEKYGKPYPHRAEIEAAMVNNLHNPYIHQLVVVLDSVSVESNCTHFISHMQRLSREIQSNHADLFKVVEEGGSSSHRLPCTLTCIDRIQRQPTYLEMFQYSSSSEFVEGPVVVMANTDQAFDTSLKLAAHLQPNAISVVSTTGFDKRLVPPSVFAHYTTTATFHDIFVPPSLLEQYKKVRERMPQRYPTQINRCEEGKDQGGSESWDAYVFHRDMVAKGLEQIALYDDDGGGGHVEHHRHSTLFVRGEKNTYYYMNEMGAENAALYDIVEVINKRGVQSPSTTTQTTTPTPTLVHVWNSCVLIHSWHFHLGDKMHKKRGRGSSSWTNRVPEPRAPMPLFCGTMTSIKLVFDDPAFVLEDDSKTLLLCPDTTTTDEAGRI